MGAGPDESELRYVALKVLGDVLHAEGKYREALEVRRDAIPAAETCGYVYQARTDLAHTLLEIDELVEAKEVIIDAIKSVPAPHPSEMARILRSAAMIARRAGEDALVRDYVREAQHYLQFDDDATSRSENAVDIGRLALRCGENEILLQVGRFLSDVVDPGMRNEGMRFLVKALLAMDRFEECIPECEKVLSDEKLMMVDENPGEWVATLARCQYHVGRYKDCLATCEGHLAIEENEEAVEILLRKLAIFSSCQLGRRETAKKHAKLAIEREIPSKDRDLNQWLVENPEVEFDDDLLRRLSDWLGL